jgi:hypothetical protein
MIIWILVQLLFFVELELDFLVASVLNGVYIRLCSLSFGKCIIWIWVEPETCHPAQEK